jgi:hypothetical protein
MKKETLRYQRLAGIITEGEYKYMTQESSLMDENLSYATTVLKSKLEFAWQKGASEKTVDFEELAKQTLQDLRLNEDKGGDVLVKEYSQEEYWAAQEDPHSPYWTNPSTYRDYNKPSEKDTTASEKDTTASQEDKTQVKEMKSHSMADIKKGFDAIKLFPNVSDENKLKVAKSLSITALESMGADQEIINKVKSSSTIESIEMELSKVF